MIDHVRSDKNNILEGVYFNFNFVSAVSAHLGNIVKVHTISGDVYEGIFRTFSPHFKVALEMVHASSAPLSSLTRHESVIVKMVFAPEEVIFFEIVDAESDSARDTFLNNREIIRLSSSESRPAVTEKILEPWDDCEESNESWELSGSEGWNPQDMFERNENLGVTSDFDSELSLYTIPLQSQRSQNTVSKSMKSESLKISTSPQSTNPNVTPKMKTEGKPKKKNQTSRKFEGVSSSFSKEVHALNSKKLQPSYKNCEKDSKSCSAFKTPSCVDPVISSLKKNIDVKVSSANAQASTFVSAKATMQSKLNPLAKEFIPANLRPTSTNYPVPAPLLCPECAVLQTRLFTTPIQPPIPYPSSPLYSWNLKDLEH